MNGDRILVAIEFERVKLSRSCGVEARLELRSRLNRSAFHGDPFQSARAQQDSNSNCFEFADFTWINFVDAWPR